MKKWHATMEKRTYERIAKAKAENEAKAKAEEEVKANAMKLEGTNFPSTMADSERDATMSTPDIISVDNPTELDDDLDPTMQKAIEASMVVEGSTQDGTQHPNYSQTSASSSVLPKTCLLYTSPSPRDRTRSRMPSSA